jgi:hypothetical protein
MYSVHVHNDNRKLYHASLGWANNAFSRQETGDK